jgi:negative regulator of sigma E activity
MPKLKLVFATILICAANSWAKEPSAQELAASAFKSPAIPFQSRLILTQWSGSDSRAEELNLDYNPPGIYRIEFLAFDGSVKKVVINDAVKKQVSMQTDKQAPSVVEYPPQIGELISPTEMSDLLQKNYKFSLKGSDTFIGRPVWVVEMTPKTDGKPTHILKIDKDTMVVLEHRRFLPNDQIGSLTRFSTFEPEKKFAEGTFSFSNRPGLSTDKRDFEMPKPENLKPPPDNMKKLPNGFELSSYNVFEVQGTQADHFYYSDGALPLSVFETKLPIHFPVKTRVSDKSDFTSVATQNLSSVDQIVYGKRNGTYITVIGEASPALLQSIVKHIN